LVKLLEVTTLSITVRSIDHSPFLERNAMKRQLFVIAAGAILLASPALTKMAFAQTAAPAKTERAGQWQQLEQSLNLTADQKTAIANIRKSSRDQMAKVLTPAQTAQLQAAKAAAPANATGKKGMHPRGLYKALNLTADQKAQMKQIRAAAKVQIDNVYTPQQKTTLQQFRASHPHRGPKGASQGTNWKSTDLVNPQK
jgi:periplasmic protein CpxP/Spy